MFASSFENFNPRKEDIRISFVSHFPDRYNYQFIGIKKKKSLKQNDSSSTQRLPDIRSRLKIFLRTIYEAGRISDSSNDGLFVHVARSHLQIDSWRFITPKGIDEREKRWILCFVVACRSRPRRMSKIKMPWQSFASAYISLSMHVDHP